MTLNGKEITLYYPNGGIIPSIEDFIDFYNDQYYSINNKEVEKVIEDILNNGIKSPVELFRVLAWVFIKINMKGSKGDSFIYNEGMDEETMQLRIYSNNDIMDKSDIKELYKIIEKYSGKCSTDEKAQNFLNEIKKLTDKKGWGKYFYSVYMITLLYFVSNGKYPIVNSSSYIALEAIYNNYNFKSIINSPKLVQPYESGFEEIITKGTYKEYMDKLKELFNENAKSRKVDQALWAYGKLFKNK